MKYLIGIITLISLFFFTVTAINAYSRTKGYFKSNGTYVQPYYRSSPNSYKWDNWSSKGNINPFNGKKGYKSWW
jgi:hypothetical protein